jgi:hypothetical protein
MINFYRKYLTRIFTPAAYLKFISNSENKNAIEKVEFIPPKLGSSGFGRIYVELKYIPESLRANNKY